MTLQDQLDAVRAQELQKSPPHVRRIREEAFDHLVSTGVSDRILEAGDRAPDFELEDIRGDRLSLKDLCRSGPVILNFFRGGWCPFCSLELRAYQSIIESIEDVGAALVAISPETPEQLREAVAENEISFPVLSDRDNETARSYGLVYALPEALRQVYEGFGLDLPHRQGNDRFELPIPATYLVDTDQRIRRAYANLDQTRRAEPEDFLQGLREVRGKG